MIVCIMSESTPLPAPRRLFTALFPDPAAGSSLDRTRRCWAGLPQRVTPALERMHMTLQFFDPVTPEQERDWLAALAELRFAPFDVELVRPELWHAPRGTIAVLRSAKSEALDELRATTDELARRAGLPVSKRPWKAHVTVLRRADKVTLKSMTEPIRWTVRHVDLIWSDLQAKPPQYHRLGRFGGTA